MIQSIQRDLQLIHGELKPQGKYNAKEKIEKYYQVWESDLYQDYKAARKVGNIDRANEIIKDQPRELQPFYAYAYYYDVQVFDKRREWVDRGRYVDNMKGGF